MSAGITLPQIRNLLAEKGIRITAQRLEIAGILLARHRHMTADQIFEELNSSMPHVSRATVFNTLREFSEKGVVKLLELHSGVALYDSNTDPHHHAVDTRSGRIYDIPVDPEVEGSLRDHLLEQCRRQGIVIGPDSELQITLRS